MNRGRATVDKENEYLTNREEQSYEDMTEDKELELHDYKKYESLTDEEIAGMVGEGDFEALDYLLVKYKNYVRAKARSYFLIGADREDSV